MNQNPLNPSNDELPSWEMMPRFQDRRRDRSPLAWWYRWAAPVDPGKDAPFEQRESFRQGRIASVILLLMLLVVIAFIPLALSSANLYTLPIVLALLVVACIAVLLNRQGKVLLVGIFIVFSVNAALVLTIITAPIIDLNVGSLPVFDLFILSELAAVTVLPAVSVFVVAFINCIYIVASILLMPHFADLGALMAHSVYTVLIRPVALQVVVAVVTYLWVRNAQDAILRADRAEVIAQLEHAIASQKRELDYGIQQLLQTMVQAANGDMSVRSPLAQGHVLWQVAVSLNTLLSRLQRSSQSDYELQRLTAELQRLKSELNWVVGALRDAKTRRAPLPLVSGNTLIEPLYRELAGHYVIAPQSRK